ncbi:hypothetical protein BJX99DRAFT_258368 [Aspergillus californicus]
MSAEPCIAAKLAADVARILDKAEVPNVLFGLLAVGLIAVDLGVGEADFVVRDDDLHSAVNALRATGFPLCEESDCRELKEDRYDPTINKGKGYWTSDALYGIVAENRYHAIAKVHFHLESFGYPDCTLLSLFTQTKLLWAFPDLILDPPTADDRVFWLSNDPRLPPPRKPGRPGACGPWTKLHPVRILSPVSLSEALILLFAQNYGHDKSVDIAWRDMFSMVVDEGETNRVLNPKYQRVWNSFKGIGPPGENVHISVRHLKEQLIAEGSLKEIPPCNNIKWLH